jgi:spore germination cell wall hydrolase CwlJ-like protein
LRQSWSSLPVLEVVRHSPRALAIAGGLGILLVAALLLAWHTHHLSPRPTSARDIAKLERLPARPEDIEAHGALARSTLKPDDARRRNAEVPFSTTAFAIAKPFLFDGSDTDRLQALGCLATAVLYEAGDDAKGQAAVAQVILNRVRHAAFPSTICGVVYQGSQRTTGCQFTFTCDGSLRRQMSQVAWGRARDVARRALGGAVDTDVGLATHYHTDWVYPYWSPELNKLARVGTHLFFGWPGSWGGPSAFRRIYHGNEAVIATPALSVDNTLTQGAADEFAGMPRLPGLPVPPVQLTPGLSKVPLYGNRLRLVSPDGHSFGLLARPDAGAEKLVNAALALCATSGPCRVSAWSNEDDIPSEYPIPAGAKGTMVFEFVREGGKSALHFDCARYPNKDPKVCLRTASGLD